MWTKYDCKNCIHNYYGTALKPNKKCKKCMVDTKGIANNKPSNYEEMKYIVKCLNDGEKVVGTYDSREQASDKANELSCQYGIIAWCEPIF